MTKSKLLAAFLVFTSFLVAFSGPGIVQNALAQPQNPPVLSSQGEKLPPEPLPEAQIIIDVDAPPTDEYIPDGEVPLQIDVPSTPPQHLLLESDSWIGSTPHGVQSDSVQGGNSTQALVLHDNGPIVTHPGAGYNGNDASALQSALGMGILGFSNSTATGFKLADDFTIPPGNGWVIDNITFYAYQAGTYGDPPASTITGLYLQIWDGSPNDPASSILFGDLVTNRLIDTYWTNIYRVLDTGLTNSERPIMAAVADVNISLQSGTYWMVWASEGSLASGPFSPPITILGQTTTGNALQYSPSSSSWGPVNDSVSGTPQGMPFVIEGSLGGWLWDQAPSMTQTGTYTDQEFPDVPSHSSYLADDFEVDGTWKINSIFVPGDGISVFDSLFDATALTWQIYADDGGIPAGDPSGASSPPVWSLTLAPSDPKVTISPGYSGNPSNTLLQLSSPLKLSSGHYWLLFYPTMNASQGGYGLKPANTNNGGVAKFINPNGGFGLGTEWQDWTVAGAPTHDFAFSIGGASGFSWKSLSSINTPGRSRPAAATVNGKIYLFGGEVSGGTQADKVERYDPVTNTWTILGGVMPSPASNICAAVIGTDIYIPGGYEAWSTYSNSLRIFHTSTTSWSVVTTDPMPAELSGMGCTILNNKLYMVGGNTIDGAQASAYLYDPAAPTGSRWSTIASLNTANANIGVVTISGKIYALGGLICPTCVEVYDPADGAWHVVTSPKTPRDGAGVYAIGTNLYVCGGGWSAYHDTCESYDTNQGNSGTWKAHPSIMIDGRRTFGYTNIGPVMYAISGYRGTYLQTAERWSFDSYLPITIK
jgi:hypothetical protein